MPEAAKPSAVRLAGKMESAYATAPSGDWLFFPAINWNLGEAVTFLENDLLGLGGDVQHRTPDVPDRRGTASFPIDADYIGIWLSLVFGPPNTSGTGPNYTHVWETGYSGALPSWSAEVQHPDTAPPIYRRLTGIKAESWSFSMQGRGQTSFDVGLLASEEQTSGATSAGTPADIGTSLRRFAPREGNVLYNPDEGSLVTVGKTLEAQFSYEARAEEQYYVGGGGAIGDVLPGVPQLGGTLRTLLHDVAPFQLAEARTKFPLRLVYTINADTSLQLDMPEAQLASGIPELGGGGAGGVPVPFNWVAGAPSGGKALTVTLKNQHNGSQYVAA